MSRNHYVIIRESCTDVNKIFVEFLCASHKYFLLNEKMHIIEKISGYFPIHESSPERLFLPTHEFSNCAV